MNCLYDLNKCLMLSDGGGGAKKQYQNVRCLEYHIFEDIP